MQRLLTTPPTIDADHSHPRASTTPSHPLPIKLVYIASPSFSGSTLLTFLLNAHPAIATVGELKWGNIDLEKYACSCGKLLSECFFWNAIRAAVVQRGLPFDLLRPPTDFRFPHWPTIDRFARAKLRGPIFEILRSLLLNCSPSVHAAWTTVQDVNRAVIETALRIQDGTIFLDASKDPVRIKHLMDSNHYTVRLIQLIRDGRAVTHSACKNKAQTAIHAATDWRSTHEQIERLAKKVPSADFLRVRYEDLCKNANSALGNIFTFLQLDPDEAAKNPNAIFHHILGNKMRLKPIASIQLDESWRRALAHEDCCDFERIAGKMNRSYGYD
ncbi:MAG: sulfotransferase [Planctomycetota bacterium]